MCIRDSTHTHTHLTSSYYHVLIILLISFRQITPDIVKKSFNYELQYFRFRALLLRIILGLTDVTIAARANYGNSSIKCSQEIKNNSPSNEINCKVTNGVHSNDELDDEKNGVISKKDVYKRQILYVPRLA